MSCLRGFIRARLRNAIFFFFFFFWFSGLISESKERRIRNRRAMEGLVRPLCSSTIIVTPKIKLPLPIQSLPLNLIISASRFPSTSVLSSTKLSLPYRFPRHGKWSRNPSTLLFIWVYYICLLHGFHEIRQKKKPLSLFMFAMRLLEP